MQIIKNSSESKNEDSIRCICGFVDDDGYTIQCEKCLVWQHCDCVLEGKPPDNYYCEECQPRVLNVQVFLLTKRRQF